MPKININEILLDPQDEWLRSKLTGNAMRLGNNLYPTVSFAKMGIPCSKTNVFIHHLIKGLPLKRSYDVVDHIDQNTFNNRRSNLRIVSKRINSLNTKRPAFAKGKQGTRSWKGYYRTTNAKGEFVYTINCSTATNNQFYFADKDEKLVARVYDYITNYWTEIEHYQPQLPPLLTHKEFEKINSTRLRGTRSPLTNVRITWERYNKRKQNQTYRIDYKTDKKNRLRKNGLESAFNFAKSLNRATITIVYKDRTSETIERQDNGSYLEPSRVEI